MTTKELFCCYNFNKSLNTKFKAECCEYTHSFTSNQINLSLQFGWRDYIKVIFTQSTRPSSEITISSIIIDVSVSDLVLQSSLGCCS